MKEKGKKGHERRRAHRESFQGPSGSGKRKKKELGESLTKRAGRVGVEGANWARNADTGASGDDF